MTTTSTAMATKPKVFISSLAMTKINYWVQASNVEISGLGKCVFDKEKEAFFVSDVYLLEQTNTGTSTDIEAGAVAKLIYETKDVEGNLNFWWHSHVNMGVFWSGTDIATIKEFGDQGFCLATVFNKRREMKSAFYQGANGFYPSMMLDDLVTEQYHEIDETILVECKKEMDEKCKTKTKTWSYHGNYKGGAKGKPKKNKGNKKIWTPDSQNQSFNQTYGTKSTGGDVAKFIKKTDLGFEYTGSELQWLKFTDGRGTYAGFTFKNTINPQFRDHGSIHPTLFTVWDDSSEIWTSIAAFVRDGLDAADSDAIIYRQPFTKEDWENMCKLYLAMFKQPPVCLEDIEEFFIDIMELPSYQSFWGVSTISNPIHYQKWKEKYDILVELHMNTERTA